MKKIRYLAGDFPHIFKKLSEDLGLSSQLDGYSTLLIEEESKEYAALKVNIESMGLSITNILERVLFNKIEIESAHNFALIALGKKRWGYPQPENNFKFRDITYAEYCSCCGIHKEQIAPFRLQKIPQWKKNFDWFTINWVFDVSFVNKELYLKHLAPLGIDFWPVIDHKDDSIIEHIVQLKMPFIEDDLREYFSDYPYETCEECGYKKPHPKYLKYFPIVNSDLPLAYTNLFFGSGASAQRRVIIRKDVVELFIKLKLIKKDTYHLWPSKPNTV